MTKIVCSVCGSDDVQAKVWVKLNENCETTTDFLDEMIDEPADCWCCQCEENQKLIIVDDEQTDDEPETFHCELCGSTDVTPKSGVQRESVDDDYCNECNQNSTIVKRSELMEDVNSWWNEASFEDMEIITGLNESDFDPADGSQAFVDACEAIWYAKSEEERIEIWRVTRHLGVYANE